MMRKVARQLSQSDVLHIAGTSFRVSQVGIHFDEATITLWPLIRTGHDCQVVLCMDKDQILKTHTVPIEEN